MSAPTSARAIVDAFMVVVLAASANRRHVYAALGLGVLNKLLEGWQGGAGQDHGPVFIVIFIQKRPQGHLRDEGQECRGKTRLPS